MAGGFDVRVRLEDNRVRLAFEQFPGAMRNASRAAILEALGELEREVVQRVPVAHGILAGKVFSALRGEETAVVRGEVAVAPPADRYALPVETGSKPHFPPLDAILLWLEAPKMKAVVLSLAAEMQARRAEAAANRKKPGARQYKQTPEEQAKRALAYLIGRKIARQGTKGAFMFRDAFEQNEERVAAHIRGRLETAAVTLLS